MIRKSLVTLLLGVAVACGMFGLTACVDNEADTIRNQITTQLEGLKSQDAGVIQNLLDAGNQEALGTIQSLGVDPYQYMNDYLQDFNYQVGNITVNGDTATVELSISCKNPYDVQQAINQGLMEIASDSYANVFLNSDAVGEVADAISSAIESAPVVELGPMEVEFVKEAGHWVPGPDVNTQILDALQQA